MISTVEKSNLLAPDSAQSPPSWSVPDARSLLARARHWSVPLKSTASRTPSLTLDLTDRTIRVRAPQVLAFVLASRTQFPVRRLIEAMHWSPARLERASSALRATERRLSELLTASLREPERMDELARGLSLKTFSKDHQWRDIMECVLRLAPEYEPYKRVAISRYLQYLRARKAALKGIFIERTADMPQAAVHTTHLAHADDVRGAHPAPSAEDRLATLPKGETVRIHLNDRPDMLLALAGTLFRLQAGRRFSLVDDDGNQLPLKKGKNLVGRHPGCDVQVDPSRRSVSRQHLLIEPIDDATVLFTDLSAHGTQIPADLI